MPLSVLPASCDACGRRTDTVDTFLSRALPSAAAVITAIGSCLGADDLAVLDEAGQEGSGAGSSMRVILPHPRIEAAGQAGNRCRTKSGWAYAFADALARDVKVALVDLDASKAATEIDGCSAVVPLPRNRIKNGLSM